MTTPAVAVEFGDLRVPATFWNKVRAQPNGCWRWIGAVNSRGYGTIRDSAAGKNKLSHRFIYELTVGPIGAGLTIDHLCHTNDVTCRGADARCSHRKCVNPGHMEPVTRGENNLRGQSPIAVNARATHCSKGHEFTEANTFVRPDTGRRACRACRFTSDPKRPGVKPGSSWSPARRAAYEKQHRPAEFAALVPPDTT